MKKIIRLLSLMTATVAVVSCSPDNRPLETLVIISTNDIHSAIDQFPKLATVVEGYRADSVEFLLVDAGDRWTGNPYVDMASEPGRPIINLMNTLGYDIATLGNHEFDNGIELLAQRNVQSAFQNVVANADLSNTLLKDIRPYAIIQTEGLKLAFLGLITTAVNGHPAGRDENFGDAVFFDPIETAREYRALRDSADVFVLISHAGLHIDTLVAAQVPEIDLIIGGHSHDILHEGGKWVGGVLVTQTGSRLRYAGVTTISHRGGKIEGIENQLILLDTVTPSPAYSALVQGIKSDPRLSVPAGRITADMDEVALLNLFSDIMREGSGAQFAFYNRGGLRADHWQQGVVTVGDVHAAEPFGNYPVVVELTEEDMARMILNKFNSSGSESHSMDLYPSGFSYTIVTDGQGNGTDVFFSHNYYPESGKIYRVAMSDYVAAQYDFDKRGTGEPSGPAITDIIFEYLKEHSPYNPSYGNRVEIRQNY